MLVAATHSQESFQSLPLMQQSAVVNACACTRRIAELPAELDTPIVCFCASGQRSALTQIFLQRVGYSQVLNGISAGHVAAATGHELVLAAEEAAELRQPVR